jgi:flagellar hook-associated protein 2
MATISSLGIGSGLDSNNIVSQLVALEKQPLKVLQAKANVVQAKMSAFGQIQSQFSALSDVVNRISAAGVWTSRSGSSTNNAAATISASATAQATSFSLDVDALAQVQSVSSNTLTAGAAVGAGTLTLRLGSWNSGGTAFTAAAASVDVPITISATDTVGDIATKINAANAGVTATAFNDGTNDRLLIRSNATGVAGGFRIQATDADGTDTDDAGLSRLAFDPATLNPATSTTFGMAGAGIPVQYGQDAKARINGLAVTSSTNTLSSNIPGVTINLTATTTTGYGTPGEVKSPISMAVKNDTTSAVKNVQDFVKAYNTLSQTLSDMTKYDSGTQTAGPFQGDTVIVGMQNVLHNMLGSVTGTGGVYQRLSDVGVQMQRDGSLSINSVKLSAAANNGTALQDLFTANNNNPLTDGFAVKFAAFTKGALNSTGMISNEAKALQRQLDANGKEQDKVNQRASAVQARLQKQYSALDAKMGSLSALNAYVAQQVTLWNKSSA